MEKKRKFHLNMWTTLLLITGLVSSCQYGLPAQASEKEYPAGRLHSAGRIECRDAVLDTDDLRCIQEHIMEKQSAVIDILLRLGTKLWQDESGIHADRDPDHAQGTIDREAVGWEELVKAVEKSQTVPTGLSVLHPDYAMRIDGVEERTDCYETAIADNISRGKAAWADGVLLLGNGADNDKAYRKGTEDGEEGILPQQMYPIYEVKEIALEVRHQHIGTKEDKDGTSGCYHNYSEVKTEEKRCSNTLYKTELSWHPDENHPDGGTWHGGYYTCANHGGTYSSPGTCPHKSTVKTTIWHHDIVCGLTDVVYGVIHIRGADTDYYDRTMLLEAELEPKEGYEQFAWQEGDGLLWTDEEGNLLGIGSQLTVNAPGVYKCCINVANADIDIRSGSVEVIVSGLVLPGN